MRFGYAKVISFCFSTMSFVKKKKKHEMPSCFASMHTSLCSSLLESYNFTSCAGVWVS